MQLLQLLSNFHLYFQQSSPCILPCPPWSTPIGLAMPSLKSIKRNLSGCRFISVVDTPNYMQAVTGKSSFGNVGLCKSIKIQCNCYLVARTIERQNEDGWHKDWGVQYGSILTSRDDGGWICYSCKQISSLLILKFFKRALTMWIRRTQSSSSWRTCRSVYCTCLNSRTVPAMPA